MHTISFTVERCEYTESIARSWLLKVLKLCQLEDTYNSYELSHIFNVSEETARVYFILREYP